MPRLILAVGVLLVFGPFSVYSYSGVKWGQNGMYSIQVKDQTWLQSAPTFFRAANRTYSLADRSLVITTSTQSAARDKLGPFQVHHDEMMAGFTQIETFSRQYEKFNATLFEQLWYTAATGTSTGDSDKLISGFPCFKVMDSTQLGYLSFGGGMFGSDFRMGRWGTGMKLNSGIEGGPLVLFDKAGNVVIISVFNQFMISSVVHDTSANTVCFGLMGSVESVPAVFATKTILYIGSKGINWAFREWGELMRYYYDRDITYRQADLTLNYLGFWTDGGAFYFYNTEPGKNYEETILMVKQDASDRNIPYQYVQYDSWWYFKDNSSHKDVTKWEPMPDVFPHGLRYMWEQTRWPASCHNRQWSHLTPYAIKNGGKYNFIVEDDIAIPQDEKFWEDLFNDARRWGLITYEQDHLNQQFADTQVTRTNVNVARNWLLQMGNGARKNGLTIQYCMSNPRHALQSLEIPVVTHARVSGDYRPGSDQWKIGIISLFAEAIGIAPFKDNFFSNSTYEPGNPYSMRETHPNLQAAVATLSMAPVAPSDKVKYTDASLLMMSANEDGLILRPSRPAISIDAQVYQAAFADGSGPVGEVTFTYSHIGTFIFGIVLAADLKMPFMLKPQHLDWPIMDVVTPEAQVQKIYQRSWISLKQLPATFSEASPLRLADCGTTDFCLYYTTPVLRVNDYDVMLIGEMYKWVPLSPQRISQIVVFTDDIEIRMKGAIGEKVFFWAVRYNRYESWECDFPESGTVWLSLFYSVPCASEMARTNPCCLNQG